MLKTLPKEIQDLINSLPPASVNNSRAIVKAKYEKAITKHPITAMNILESIGIYLDADYLPQDEGMHESDIKSNQE